jgi:hypothetical protein
MRALYEHDDVAKLFERGSNTGRACGRNGGRSETGVPLFRRGQG